ncbi:MAG: hypothetical protein J1G04_05320 [Clostridiales bacterium]|nr:hypothetical protein [Clostridiales bacterium]
MKKLCFLFAAVMTAVTVLWLTACADSPLDNVSERRCAYFSATDGDGSFKLTAVSGEREDPYVSDGVAGKLVPYTLITFAPTDENMFDVDGTYTYEAVIDGGAKKYGGALVVHPFAASFSAEFPFETRGAFTVTVYMGEGVKRVFELHNQVDGAFMSVERAIGAAKQELDPTGKYEIRARIINNPLTDGLCWHVAFYFDTGGTCGVLLEPVTAKVLAVKALAP